VIPIKGLVEYYENEFVSLSAEIARWDKQIKDSVEAINRINGQINLLETELRAKKNADSKKYSAEILALKTKLDMQRARYKQAKTNMLQNGENICKKLEDISSAKASSISDKYGVARQQIKDTKIEPSRVGSAVPVTFTKLRIFDNTTKFLSPLSEMLVWHQNEIDELYKIAVQYNAKVKDVVAQDAELTKQLEPVNSKLNEYKTDTKKYKQEIATLKKQKSALEKQRKLVSDSMEKDSNELADALKLLRTEIQASAKERFTDIIANITFLFQEKPAL
jgi:chromosome segregation ATPase